MWLTLVQLALAQTTITVGAGESVRDAVRTAPRGATVVVSAGADTEGFALLGSGIEVTVVSATSEPVEICALELRTGATVHLERVIVRAHPFGAEADPRTWRSILMRDGALTGRDVELRQAADGNFGLFQQGGKVDVEGLVARGYRLQRPLFFERSSSSREVALRDCDFSGNRAGVIAFRGSATTGDKLTIDGCSFDDNSSQSASLVLVEGAGAVKVFGTTFGTNDAAQGAIEIAGPTDYLEVHTSTFCPGRAMPHIRVGPSSTALIHRTVFHGPEPVATPVSIQVAQGYPWIVHNTFVGNPRAGQAERALGFAPGASGVVANNIFHKVGGVGDRGPDGGDIRNNLVAWVEPGWLLDGDPDTILQDPAFVDTFVHGSCAARPLLTPGSPAVDAGAEIPEVEDPVDDPGAPDLGAYPLGWFDPSDPADPGDPGDPVDPDPVDERWLTGGGCSSVAAPSLLGSTALALLVIARRRRSRIVAGRELRA